MARLWAFGHGQLLRSADNRLEEETDWDNEALGRLLQELETEGLPLDVTGFDPREIDALLAECGVLPGVEQDEVPEPPEDPVTQPGDLWLLGQHRLLCGDSTKTEDVVRLMDGKRATLFATDPPYLVDYGGTNHSIQEEAAWYC